MYCHRCGYSLAHLPTNRCPECGEPFDPADPATFAGRDHPRFLRAWMHLPLVAAASTVGLIGGALLGAYVGVSLLRSGAAMGLGVRGVLVLMFLVGPPCILGGAFAGLKGLSRAVIRLLPVDCPRCHGPAFYEPGKRVRYQCARCGHVYDMPVYQR